jgi:hypothetical protein
VPLTKPCRFAFFHVGLRFLGREEFTALKLPEGPLDFFGYLGLVVTEPLLFEVQYSQSPLDDFIRVLVGTRLDSLGDQFFMFRSKGDRHTRLTVIVVIVAASAHHGNARGGGAVVVAGSTTSGADGNVSTVPLPGGFNFLFSGIGVFYPDHTPTQRVGIVPDIVVTPTIEGIRVGRDEVLEAAILHLERTSKHPPVIRPQVVSPD